MRFSGIRPKREERLLESQPGRRYTAAAAASSAVDPCHRMCARTIMVAQYRALVPLRQAPQRNCAKPRKSSGLFGVALTVNPVARHRQRELRPLSVGGDLGSENRR